MNGEAHPRYYPRQDVTHEDLNALFSHDDALFLAHNRETHGCGIVRGLAVTVRSDRKSVTVGSGYALDSQGHEIAVPHPVEVPLDCAPPEDLCLDPDEPASDGERCASVYIGLRYRPEWACYKPLSPEACAPLDDCEPTRWRDGYEIKCLPEKPHTCAPEFNLPGCSSHYELLRALFETGDMMATGLFGCAAPPDEEWLTLARIDYIRDESGECVCPKVSYEDRAYLPSTQFLLRMTRILGAQALKRQLARKVIAGFFIPPVAIPTPVLRVNRGRSITDFRVAGREFQDAIDARFSHPSVEVVSGPTVLDENTLRLHMRVSLNAPVSEVGLLVTLRSGTIIDSRAQDTPAVVQLVNSPLIAIPAIRDMEPGMRAAVIARLDALGYSTAQALAGANLAELEAQLGGDPDLSVVIDRTRASELIVSTRELLAVGVR